MDLGLAGKTVFITGAGGGIGWATAQVFASEGANLALSAHTSIGQLKRRLQAGRWKETALALEADVTDPLALEAAFERALAVFGRVDVCVVNAGVWPPPAVRLDEMAVERVELTLSTNLLGALWTSRAFLRALARTGPSPEGNGACLVFIGSTAGRFGERGHADYSASKAGLYGLVRTLKNEIVEIDPRARVNMVEPGWTATEMARPALAEPGVVESVLRTMALRQLARPEDIGRAVALLASPAAGRHITGEVLTVAGGMEGRVLWEEEEIDPRGVLDRL